MPSQPKPKSDLEKMADSAEPGLVSELWEFLSQNKKWWLIPILVVLGLFGVVAALASSPVAPFIYALF
jgi:Family of unknown function (DUF5989)